MTLFNDGFVVKVSGLISEYESTIMVNRGNIEKLIDEYMKTIVYMHLYVDTSTNK